MSAHAELVILRHELAETRRKLDAERVNTDNAYIKLAEAQRECEQLRRVLSRIEHESGDQFACEMAKAALK